MTKQQQLLINMLITAREGVVREIGTINKANREIKKILSSTNKEAWPRHEIDLTGGVLKNKVDMEMWHTLLIESDILPRITLEEKRQLNQWIFETKCPEFTHERIMAVLEYFNKYTSIQAIKMVINNDQEGMRAKTN